MTLFSRLSVIPRVIRQRIPLIATLLIITLGIMLGNWQMRRAAEKQAQEAAQRPNVEIKGEFVSSWPIYLDNRPHQGVAGFYLVMPLKIAGTDQHVLVERGWFPRNAQQRTQLPSIATPPGIVTVVGTAKPHVSQVFQLGKAEPLHPGAITQNLDLQSFRKVSGLHLKDFVLEQTNAAPDNLIRDWPRATLGIEKHYGYAFQWYALAGMAFLFFVVTRVRLRGK